METKKVRTGGQEREKKMQDTKHKLWKKIKLVEDNSGCSGQ